MTDFLGEGVAKATVWECRRCGYTNKAGTRDCGQCAHEPVLGRLDFEQRRWDESHKEVE